MAGKGGEVIGLGDLEKALRKATAEVEAALTDAVQDAAEAVKDDARRNVPVDTGKLRNSIGVRVKGTTAQVGVSGRDAHYGTFIEHGTSARPARPFMMPAAERERRKIEGRIRDHVRRATG